MPSLEEDFWPAAREHEGLPIHDQGWGQAEVSLHLSRGQLSVHLTCCQEPHLLQCLHENCSKRISEELHSKHCLNSVDLSLTSAVWWLQSRRNSDRQTLTLCRPRWLWSSWESDLSSSVWTSSLHWPRQDPPYTRWDLVEGGHRPVTGDYTVHLEQYRQFYRSSSEVDSVYEHFVNTKRQKYRKGRSWLEDYIRTNLLTFLQTVLALVLGLQGNVRTETFPWLLWSSQWGKHKTYTETFVWVWWLDNFFVVHCHVLLLLNVVFNYCVALTFDSYQYFLRII